MSVMLDSVRCCSDLLKVGYAGGDIENPSYQDVCTGATKHNEVVRVR